MFIEEQKAQHENTFLRGRQIAFVIYDYFRSTGTGDSILDFSDLVGTSLPGDNVQGFETNWDDVLPSMKKISEDGFLDFFYNMRLGDSGHMQSILALFFLLKIQSKNFTKFVEHSESTKIRFQTFDSGTTS